MATIKRIVRLFLMTALVTMTGVMTSCNDDVNKGSSDLSAGGWFADDDNGVFYDYEAYNNGATIAIVEPTPPGPSAASVTT